MGKKESKLFRKGLKVGKNGTKRSEEELLYLLYSPEEVKAAENRIIDRKIAKRDKEIEKKGLKTIPPSPGQERTYQYRRIMPENGLINEMEITEKQYNDPNYPGYKQRYQKVPYKGQNGEEQFIKAGHKGSFTKEEQEEYNRIMKAKKDLENKQKTFGEER